MRTESLILAIPDGRLFDSSVEILNRAGYPLQLRPRSYQPLSSSSGLEFLIMKPRDIPMFLDRGLIGAGLLGRDIVLESGVELNEMIDLELAQVQLALAGAGELSDFSKPRIATKYPVITRRYFESVGLEAELIRSSGCTEGFVPMLSDFVVEIVESGDTLKSNGLKIIDTLMSSTTCLFASPTLKPEQQIVLYELSRDLEACVNEQDTILPKRLQLVS